MEVNIFGPTGTVICVACRPHMRLLSLIPDHQGVNEVSFGCTKCARVRRFNLWRLACQPAEGEAA